MSIQPLPVYLLAGGQSSRFGSDKALALLGGEALLTRIATLLEPYASSLHVITAPGRSYQPLGLDCLFDVRSKAGPMAGLETALEHALHQGSDWLLLASCDVWGVTGIELDTLLTAPRAGYQAVAWRADGIWQPLWALYHTRLLPEVRRRLDAGEAAPRRLLAEIPVQTLDGSGLDWIQINRPEDLKAARASFGAEAD